MNASRTRIAQILLLSVALVWGGGFIAQRLAMQAMGPHTFNFIRFGIGCIVLLPLLYLRRVKFSKTLLLNGSVLGGLLFLGAATQQIGMQYTTAGKGGFITSLYIILVPLLGRLLFHERVSNFAWVGSFLSLVGLYLLAVQGDFSLALGDTWVLACAFVFALHVIAIGRFAANFEPISLAFVQYLVTIACSFPLAYATESVNITAIISAWPTYCYAGIISIGFGYTAQVFAQRYTGATESGIILSLESVFAAVFGILLLQESMISAQYAGCALMLFGTFLAQLPNGSLVRAFRLLWRFKNV
jgi:drug/metabolite transporter (DMT)-like permease